MAGITSAGFTRKTLGEIITETKDTVKETFGSNQNVAENSFWDKIITIQSNRESDVWEVLEDVFYSQTLVGAENKYLDDILSKRGIFRKGKTAASGTNQMTIDNTVAYTTIYAKDSLSVLEGTFKNSSDFSVAGNISAIKIKNTDVPAGSYIFTILNHNTSVTESLNLTLVTNAVGSADLNNFYQAIKDFIVDNTVAGNTDYIQIDTASGTLYAGFNTSLELSGLNSTIDLKSTPIVGERTINFDVLAVDKGFNRVYAKSVTSISPTPPGFISITNINGYFTGTDVESDASYRARASTTTSSGEKATRAAIISGMLDGVEGLKNIRLFPNPTGTTSPEGVPPHSLMVVSYGGTTQDISETLYDLVGTPTNTYGNVGYTVYTEDNSTETIYHSKAIEKKISVRVSYKTTNNKPLTDTEKNNIISNISDLSDTFNINSTVFNVQLTSAVTSVVNISRFSQLDVETKDKDDPDTSYSTANVNTGVTEICVILDEDITFLQNI